MRIDELTRHELSMAFPLAGKDDLAALKESIQSRGFDSRHPIILYEGQVLDGWHRSQVCLELGVDPSFEHFNGSTEEAVDLVFSQNMARRQLSKKQKASYYLIANENLPIDRQLTHTEIAARVGLKDTRAIAQLEKLDPETAAAVASGNYPANKAVRDTLRQEPADRKEKEPRTGAGYLMLTVRNRNLISRFSGARKSQGMTVIKATNKALELYSDWAERQAS